MKPKISTWILIQVIANLFWVMLMPGLFGAGMLFAWFLALIMSLLYEAIYRD